KNRGRIWKIDTPDAADSEIRKETEQILGEDFESHPKDELLQLLNHQDMRVRMKAQFELAERGDSGAQTFQKAIATDDQLRRLHGIWGVRQLARKEADFAEPLIALLSDSDPEVRAQAAKVLGDVQYEEAGEPLIPLLKDDED